MGLDGWDEDDGKETLTGPMRVGASGLSWNLSEKVKWFGWSWRMMVLREVGGYLGQICVWLSWFALFLAIGAKVAGGSTQWHVGTVG